MRYALEPAEYPYLDYRRASYSLGIVTEHGIWLAGCTAASFDAAHRRVVVAGGLVEQAERIIEKLRVALAAERLDLGGIVQMQLYVTSASLADLPALDHVYDREFPAARPQIGVIVVERLLRQEALIEIDAVATRDGARCGLTFLPSSFGETTAQARARADRQLAERGLMPDRLGRELAFLTPDARTSLDGPMQVIMPRLADPRARVQIETALAPTRKIVVLTSRGAAVEGDVVAQCRDIYDRLGRRLRSLGSGLEQVVKTTEFVTPGGLAAYRGTAAIRREVFAPPYPAATGVVCSSLPLGADLAVEAIAVLP